MTHARVNYLMHTSTYASPHPYIRTYVCPQSSSDFDHCLSWLWPATATHISTCVRSTSHGYPATQTFEEESRLEREAPIIAKEIQSLAAKSIPDYLNPVLELELELETIYVLRERLSFLFPLTCPGRGRIKQASSKLAIARDQLNRTSQ